MKTTAAIIAAALAGFSQAAALPEHAKFLARRETNIPNVQHTFFGYPDNGGSDIAYDCGRGYTAGGSGSYDDPLTFATAPGEFDQCEIIYDTYTKKYLRFEDTCEKCTEQYANGQYHIDIWTGSSTVDGGQDQIDCEDQITPSGPAGGYAVVRGGSQDEDVNTGDLYSPDSGCHPENVFP